MSKISLTPEERKAVRILARGAARRAKEAAKQRQEKQKAVTKRSNGGR